MAGQQAPQMKTLTAEQAKGEACGAVVRGHFPHLPRHLCTALIEEGLEVYDKPENKEKIDAAIAAAGGDQAKLMVEAMPVALAVGAPILTKYGFTADPMGVMQLIAAVSMATAGDPELAAQFAELRSRILPTA